MKDYEVIMNIDIDKERQSNLLIVSSSFDEARKIAGNILTENKNIKGIETKIFQLEEEYVVYSYIGNGIRN